MEKKEFSKEKEFLADPQGNLGLDPLLLLLNLVTIHR